MALVRTVFLAIQMPLALTLGASNTLYGKGLVEAIKNTSTKEAAYEIPTQQELEKAQQLFYSLFASPNTDINTKAWDSLGFEVKKINPFILIQEKQATQTGKGVYVFNTFNTIGIAY